MTEKQDLQTAAAELGLSTDGTIAELLARVALAEEELSESLVDVVIRPGVAPEFYPGIGIRGPGDVIRVDPSTLPNDRFESPPSPTN